MLPYVTLPLIALCDVTLCYVIHCLSSNAKLINPPLNGTHILKSKHAQHMLFVSRFLVTSSPHVLSHHYLLQEIGSTTTSAKHTIA
jgi:hypothetical protein